MQLSRARWNTAWAWTSAPDSRRLERPAAAAEARAKAESAARYACKQDEHGGDQSHDGRQAQRKADPVGNRSENNRNKDSNHCFPSLGGCFVVPGMAVDGTSFVTTGATPC